MSKKHDPIEMDLALGSAKPYGSSRSIVRRIGTSLPIKPCPRVHFQLYPYTEDVGVSISITRPEGLVASLADVGWIDRDDDEEEEEGNYFGRPRSRVPVGLVFRAQPSFLRKPRVRRRSLPSLHQESADPQGPSTANDEAIQKISALETELAKLRAQIAQIVLAQEKGVQPAAAVPPPAPCGTLPPPPPPPPPPLPPPPGLQRTFSAIDLIKERRGKKAECQTDLDLKPAEIPSMLDVLKDMSKVKLRSVKSRPVEENAKVKFNEPTDAAALIAEALKRKFAHRYRHDSERDDVDSFKLPVAEAEAKPETPMFGQHMLRATGKRKLV
ncbi:mitochondrial fission regulator 1 [Gouania willdenowi]|uniref:Mitochondrial fission regulator n=1 Tax=Gouania willdenowi TaxID=441366 RepID=A0A8C5GMP5_GOUWI|nr:mitochondrial fission regulator 1 [Gouania willdenowi]